MATNVQDSFSDTAATALEAHTGELGASWAKQTGFTGSAVITPGKRLRANTINTPTAYLASGTPSGTDYDLSAEYLFNTNVDTVDLLVRAGVADQSAYGISYSTSGGGFQIYKYPVASTTGVALGPFAAFVPIVGSIHQIKVSVRAAAANTATRIQLYLDGSLTALIDVTDSTSPYTTGKVGVRLYTTGTPSDASMIQIDNLLCIDAPAIVSDTFTGTGGTTLEAHNPDVGPVSSWQRQTFSQGGAVLTASNRVRAAVASTQSCAYVNLAVPAAPNYLVSADLYFAGLGEYCGLLVRAGSTGGDSSGYHVYYDAVQAAFVLAKYPANGVGVVLGPTAPVSLVVGSTHNLRVLVRTVAAGARIMAFLDGAATPLLDYTDILSPILTAGRAGIRWYCPTTPSDTVGCHVDNLLIINDTQPTFWPISIVTAGGVDTISYSAATPGSLPLAGYAEYMGTYPGAESLTPAQVQAGPGAGSFRGLTAAAGGALYYVLRAYDTLGLPSTFSPSNEVSSGVAGVAIAATNTGLLYSPANWAAISGGRMRSVNTGAYIKTIFTGTSCQATFDVSLNASPFPLVAWRIDNSPVWSVASVAAVVSLTPAALAAGSHLLELVYMASPAYAPATDRWSTPVSALTFTGLVVDSGASVSLPQRRSKTVLVYGDSISEGLRVYGSGGTDLTNSDARLSYASLLGPALDAEVGVIAFGGSGPTVAGSGNVPALPTSYNQYYQGVARSLSVLSGGPGNAGDSRVTPDVVIYLEGTNDVAAGATAAAVQNAMQTVMAAVLAAAPAVKQLVLQPFNATPGSAVGTGLQAAGAALVGGAVTYVDTTGWISAGSDTSDGLHPWAWTHAAKILPRVAPLADALLLPSGAAGARRVTMAAGFTG